LFYVPHFPLATDFRPVTAQDVSVRGIHFGPSFGAGLGFALFAEPSGWASMTIPEISPAVAAVGRFGIAVSIVDWLHCPSPLVPGWHHKFIPIFEAKA
jgi:hypothetical protein